MNLKHGDFSELADNYAKYRPGYSKSVLDSLISIVDKNDIDFADVGAGTGIWTRAVAGHKNISSITAVEPNDNMRKQEELDKNNVNIKWIKGSGEKTNLKDNSYDLVSMASSFHWVDFDKGMKEFSRVLRSGGRFVAIWNPRYLEDNPVLVDIENKVKELTPKIKRVSSGKSKFVKELTDKFLLLDEFDDLIFIEGRHSINLTKEQYIGAWHSVNDIQFQMGDKWYEFMQYVEDKIFDLEYIKSTYLTRAWSIRKK
jgi:ubiquinone/menaquinone biosynthesis C-methylase UbiE